MSEGLIPCSSTKPESYGRGSRTSSGTGADDGRVCGITGRPSSLFRIRSDLLVGCFGGLEKRPAFEKDVSAPSRWAPNVSDAASVPKDNPGTGCSPRERGLHLSVKPECH